MDFDLQCVIVHIIMLLSFFFTVYVFYNFFKEKNSFGLSYLDDKERSYLFKIRLSFIIIIVSTLIMAVILAICIYEDHSYSGHSGMTNWSTQEIEAYNNQFTSYKGNQSKTQVLSLLDRLITVSQIFRDESEKVPSVIFKDLFTETSIIYDTEDYDLYSEYVSSLKELKKQLGSASYNVSFEYHTNGSIDKVIIESKGVYGR